MGLYDNYPMGTYSGDPDAPWNEPDGETEETGGDEWPPMDGGRLRELYARVLERGREVRDDSLQVPTP